MDGIRTGQQHENILIFNDQLDNHDFYRIFYLFNRIFDLVLNNRTIGFQVFCGFLAGISESTNYIKNWGLVIMIFYLIVFIKQNTFLDNR